MLPASFGRDRGPRPASPPPGGASVQTYPGLLPDNDVRSAVRGVTVQAARGHASACCARADVLSRAVMCTRVHTRAVGLLSFAPVPCWRFWRSRQCKEPVQNADREDKRSSESSPTAPPRRRSAEACGWLASRSPVVLSTVALGARWCL